MSDHVPSFPPRSAEGGRTGLRQRHRARFFGSLSSTLNARHGLQVESLAVPLTVLSTVRDGLKDVHVSDTRFGALFREIEGHQLTAVIHSLDPALLAFTSDPVSRRAHGEARTASHVLEGLPAQLGVFAIIDDPYHWTVPAAVTDAIGRAVTLLRNVEAPVERDGGRHWFTGVDDGWEDQQGLEAASAQPPRNEPGILLASGPDFADEVAADGRVGLQLAEHTHGGQKYSIGLRRVRRMYLYANRAVGLLAPPVRFTCRPEIPEILLRSNVNPTPSARP